MTYRINNSTDVLKLVDNVLFIGGGYKKIIALRGTLKTGLVNHLITNEKTARTLIEMH